MQPAHLSRRSLLAGSAATLATLGSASVALHGDASPGPRDNPGDAISHDLRRYGALGDGVADDTGPVHRAIADAQRSGGEVFVPPGRYRLTKPLEVTSSISIRGVGDASAFVAGRAMPEMFRVTIPKRGTFTDLTFDGAGLAERCITQTVPQMTSVGTRWVRCKFTGARSIQMVNHGCEDVTYLDCATDGDESRPATIPEALSVYVPNGAVRIIGGEWFGRCTFNFQQVTILSSTIGPLLIDNPDHRSDSILFVQGCYLYDGGVHHDSCVDTNTSLSNIHLSGCYFAAGVQSSYLNGHLPEVFVRAQDCIFVQPPQIADGTVSHILTASGRGQLIVDGGRAALRPGGALHALDAVDPGGIQIAIPVPCVGMT